MPGIETGSIYIRPSYRRVQTTGRNFVPLWEKYEKCKFIAARLEEMAAAIERKRGNREAKGCSRFA